MRNAIYLLVLTLLFACGKNKTEKSNGNPSYSIASTAIKDARIENSNLTSVTIAWEIEGEEPDKTYILKEMDNLPNPDPQGSYGLENFAVVAKLDGSARSWTDENAAQLLTHTYMVRLGGAPDSPRTKVVAQGEPYLIFMHPRIDPAQADAVLLNWNFAAMDAYRFYIYRYLGDAVTLIDQSITSTPAINDLYSFSDASINPGNYYRYSVEACPTGTAPGNPLCLVTDPIGISFGSASVGAITNLSATMGSDGNVILRWSYSGEALFMIDLQANPNSGSAPSLDLTPFKTIDSQNTVDAYDGNGNIRSGNSYTLKIPMKDFIDGSSSGYTMSFTVTANVMGAYGTPSTVSINTETGTAGVSVLQIFSASGSDGMPRIYVQYSGNITSYIAYRCEATSGSCSSCSTDSSTQVHSGTWEGVSDPTTNSALPYFQEYYGSLRRAASGSQICYKFRVYGAGGTSDESSWLMVTMP